jgi:hypothetical protein
VWIGSTMTMSIKVQKPFLVIMISTHHWVWRGKRWKTPLWTCVVLSKAIVTTKTRNVSWVVVHSLSQRHQSNGYLDHQWYDHTYTMKISNCKMWRTKMSTSCCKEVKINKMQVW